jgi:hypothetical protein
LLSARFYLLISSSRALQGHTQTEFLLLVSNRWTNRPTAHSTSHEPPGAYPHRAFTPINVETEVSQPGVISLTLLAALVKAIVTGLGKRAKAFCTGIFPTAWDGDTIPSQMQHERAPDSGAADAQKTQ